MSELTVLAPEINDLAARLVRTFGETPPGDLALQVAEDPSTLTGLLALAREFVNNTPAVHPDPLTPAQRRFVTLEKRKAEVKAFMEELEAATLALVEEMGVGAFFQDEEGTVYKTVVPAGRFVRFEKYGVERTRRAGESKGALSLTDARAAGFQVEGK